MTNSESLLQFGSNAYAKPATALNVLRETILGRELFDFAFKEYANRWKFKRPMPADFFRTMEDASGVDLDWFWRGWFYSTDHVDIGIEGVSRIDFDTNNPYIEKPGQLQARSEETPSLSDERNQDLPKRTDRFPELKDFYNQYDELHVTADDEKAYERFMSELSDEQKETLSNLPFAWLVELKNIGGVVMPVILEIEFEDGTTELRNMPAEIWRYDNEKVSKLLVTEKMIKQITLDPRGETADASVANNHYPPMIEGKPVPLATRSRRFGGGDDDSPRTNPMREALKSIDEPKPGADTGGDEKKADEKSGVGGSR